MGIPPIPIPSRPCRCPSLDGERTEASFGVRRWWFDLKPLPSDAKSDEEFSRPQNAETPRPYIRGAAFSCRCWRLIGLIAGQVFDSTGASSAAIIERGAAASRALHSRCALATFQAFRNQSLKRMLCSRCARCSRQSGRTSTGRAPQLEQRSRQRSAGTSIEPASADTSTAADRPQSQVAKIDRTPRLRMLARSIAGPSNRRGMARG